MFYGAAIYNQLMHAWDVGQVTTTVVRPGLGGAAPPPTAQPGHTPQTECMCRGAAQKMFYEAAAYNQPMNAWDVGKVTNTWVRLGLGGAALNPLHSPGTRSRLSACAVARRSICFSSRQPTISR